MITVTRIPASPTAGFDTDQPRTRSLLADAIPEISELGLSPLPAGREVQAHSTYGLGYSGLVRAELRQKTRDFPLDVINGMFRQVFFDFRDVKRCRVGVEKLPKFRQCARRRDQDESRNVASFNVRFDLLDKLAGKPVFR